MTDKTEYMVKEFISGVLSFFFEGWIAMLLWNGVGYTLLGLPRAGYWQILGLTIMVTFILPSHRLAWKRLEKLIWDKDGSEKP